MQINILYNYALVATDPDAGDVLVYSLPTAPVGMTIDATTGFIQWVPGVGDIGSHSVQATVTDSRQLTVTQGFSVVVSEALSQIVVFAEDFEIGNNEWRQDSQNDWFGSGQRVTSGVRAAEIDGFALNSLLISPLIDLRGKSNAGISFSWYIESGFDAGEYIAVDVSTNGGSSWEERARLRGNVDPENVWRSVNIESNDISSLRIRFRGSVSELHEDGNIDDVIITAW